MFDYSEKSAAKLGGCHMELQQVMWRVVKDYDNTIIQGQRTLKEQEENLRAGKTTTMQSKHLHVPSDAVDASPFPIPEDWGSLNEVLKHFPLHDRRRIINIIKERIKFYHFAGYVQGVAYMMDIPIRWGGDWDGDKDFSDQKFDDLVHFERP